MAIVRTGASRVIPLRFAGAGGFGGGPYSDLLLYHSTASAIYRVGADGAVGRIDTPELRAGWTHLLAGRFGGRHGADLLCYDRSSGFAMVLNTSARRTLIERSRFNFVSGWTHLVRGRFGPAGADDNVLCYNNETGRAGLYQFDGRLLQSLRALQWAPGWQRIVRGNFGGSVAETDLFLYRRRGTGGLGQFHSVSDIATVTPLGPPLTDLAPYSFVVPGTLLASGATDLLCMYATTGDTAIYTPDGRGGLQTRRGYNFGAGWTQVVGGRFSNAERTHIAFYDRRTGRLRLWWFSDSGAVEVLTPPTIRYFRAVPRAVDYGATVRLRWDVREATSIEITPELGPVGDRGELPVQPKQPRAVYTLHARNGSRLSSATVAIDVHGAPEPPPPPLVAATLQGTYLALNLATAAQPVQLTLQGTLLASNGTIGRTSFRESVSGQLPAGPGVIPGTPPALGTVSFAVANLQPGRWRVQAASNVAATVSCDVVVPGVLRINATGDAGYGPVCT